MNIDERCYGYEPAASQLNTLRQRLAGLSERCRKMEESALYQHDRIVATDKRLAEAEALLREIREDAPHFGMPTDRIDAFLAPAGSAADRENEGL